jgi:4'-phosphopantetheinyl transferase
VNAPASGEPVVPSPIRIDSGWGNPGGASGLVPGDVHVWRVALDAQHDADGHLHDLAADERTRVARFYSREHGRRYAVAHATLRRVLAWYTGAPARSFRFDVGAHGKPSLPKRDDALQVPLHFNLSHSADIALIAVSLSSPVGVDVEWWRPQVQHRAVAERFFSEGERRVLAALEEETAVVRGFFSAWSRKEAYLKATGDGITRGLHHFDVSLDADAPAELLADRLDASATARWVMANIDVAPRYSAALVAARPVTAVRLLDAAGLVLPT